MESEKSDIELMDKIRQGDMTAFGLLYARYADLIYRHILVRVNSSFDADDIFQSFFLNLWEKRDSIQINTSVKGYLLTWLKNFILNTIREEQIRTKYHTQGQENWTEAHDYTWTQIVATDLDEKLKKVVAQFPPRLQTIYLLSREENLTIKEIAERLSLSKQTVKNQLTEALRRLRTESGKKNFIFFI